MKRKNNKVILLCGYSRGGTNIVWNLLQSHPNVCTPIYETGTIFRKTNPLKFHRVISLLKKTNLMDRGFAKKVIDYQLFRYKVQSLDHPENQYKGPDQKYTRREIRESALCLKSVDYDIDLTDMLHDIYPNLYLIFLTRNGYAVSEGHIRRGKSADSASKLYTEIYKKMRYYMENDSKAIMIKFEDAIKDPFGMAEKLLKFCDFQSNELEYLRLKSKKTINKGLNHDTGFGRRERKYWFDKKSIHEMIVEDVNGNQIERLEKSSIEVINKNASEAFKYFGYDIIG